MSSIFEKIAVQLLEQELKQERLNGKIRNLYLYDQTKTLIDNLSMLVLPLLVSLTLNTAMFSMNTQDKARLYLVRNFSGKEIGFSLINDQQLDSLKKTHNLSKLDSSLMIGHKPTFKLDHRIIHQYFVDRKEKYHLFESYDDYVNFFDSKATNGGPAMDYTSDYKLVYFYDLRPKVVREVFKDISIAEPLFTFPNNLYKVYEVKGYSGVFMLLNNGHFHEAFWYPDYETFQIDYQFLRKMYGH